MPFVCQNGGFYHLSGCSSASGTCTERIIISKIFKERRSLRSARISQSDDTDESNGNPYNLSFDRMEACNTPTCA
jgi:hypothetical protein